MDELLLYWRFKSVHSCAFNGNIAASCRVESIKMYHYMSLSCADGMEAVEGNARNNGSSSEEVLVSPR